MMGQNTSSAVMQQRAEPHDSLDDFPTPPWGARALCEHVLKPLYAEKLANMRVWEPACNRGFLVRGLEDYFGPVMRSDIFDYGIGAPRVDFLFAPAEVVCEFVITNPPFRLAHAFIDHALKVSRLGCAMLVRTSFLEGVNRYDSLFRQNPPAIVAQFAERLPMRKGRVDPELSSATSYCWLVWFKGAPVVPRMAWIPPCRKHLERAGDYDLPEGVA